MLHCKDCEKYWETNDPEYGVCSLPESLTPVKNNEECMWLKVKKYHCEDCVHFLEFGCLTTEAKDEICSGFLAKEYIDFQNILLNMLKHNIDVKAKVNELLNEFENSDIYKFIDKNMKNIEVING